MLSRDEFAAAVLIQLATRGERLVAYDAGSFCLVQQASGGSGSMSGRTSLARWYEKYQAAEKVGRGDEAIADVVESWVDSRAAAESERPLNKSRLVPLVRSRFDYEFNALHTAAKSQGQPRDLMDLFIHQPLAEHLDVILAEDTPDLYVQVTRPMLQQLGLSWDESLRLAIWNLPQIDPGFGLERPFAQQSQGHWSYIAPPSELFTSWLLFPEKVRRISVKGKHVAFVPKVDRLAITGSDEIDVVRLLARMTVDALQDAPGRSVSAIPFVLEASGWKPWLPPASHPLYWSIKELHVAAAADQYANQRKLLKEHLDSRQGEEAPVVAEFQANAADGPGGQRAITTWTLWSQWVHTILPRTEAVFLAQLLNPEEMNADANVEPRFGEEIFVTWQQLADYLGPRLKRLDYYPERYQVAGDDFPEGDAWARLAASQPTFPLEGKPGVKPQPLPKLAPMMTAEAIGPIAAAPTQLAQPFAPPAAHQPPPEPSLWPLALLCLFGLTCLGGGVGVLVIGIQWLHGALQSTGGAEIAQADAPVHPAIQQVPPIVAPIPPRPVEEPALPDPSNEFEEMFAAAREAQARIREAIDRGAPDVSPLESFPEQSMPEQAPREPPPDTLPPLPELEKPEQALPLLTFGPTDLQPLGPEIRGDSLFQDIAPAGGWLVGFRVTKGRPWNGAIVALQPIYQVGGEYRLGQSCGSGQQALEHAQFLARPGYAIGKVEARFGLIMNALRIEFQRVDGASLTPANSYTTEWFGAEGGGPHSLDGGGSPLVGLAGSFEREGELISIQLLRKKP